MSNDHPTPPGPHGSPGPAGGPQGHPGRPPGPYAHPAHPGSYGHPPQPGPYGPPATSGPYGPPAVPGPYGPPVIPGPYGGPGMPYGPPPYGPPVPYAMPQAVRGAQVLNFVMGGLGVLFTVLAGALVSAYAAGRVLAPFLPACVLFVLAFLYPKAGNGVRIASIVLAAVQILIALGATANGTPGAVVPLGGAVAVIVLLGRRSASQWFGRPRTPALPPQPPYA
ncbi:hypothetical protein AB0E88_25070 [Streptomyces sp. NPDC028635]|uniref:hypothetical protein n=1 Tax=Streptomyces sp. NPDC028635 TaxID=3154800 RepID=UPI0033C366CE